MTLGILVIILAAFLGSMVQTVVGFGMLLFLTPILLIFLPASTAIMSAFLAGIVMAVLILLGEKRKGEIVKGYLPYLLTASLPGVVLGTFILAHTPKAYLLIIVGLTVITGLAIQQVSFSTLNPKYESGKWMAVTCFVAGIFNGATSMSGPVLALWLRSFSNKIHEIRDTFSISFIFLNTVSFISIILAKPNTITDQSIIIMILLVPVILIGHKLGNKILKRININHFKLAFSLAILATGIFSLISGITNL